MFDIEDEEDFDRNIAMLVRSSYQDLYDNCKKIDKNDKGEIKIEEFKSVLKRLGIEIPKEVFHYMLLLFYSHNNELNSVPYKHFLNAYGSENPSENSVEEYSEEAQAKIVRHYLGLIAQSLNKVKKSVKTVFIADNKNRITPDQFVAALEYLGLAEISREHIILMLEALQFDEDEHEVFINIDEFEEILAHYGVGPENGPEIGSSDRDISESESLGHVKKISLLEGEYEYDEDMGNRKKTMFKDKREEEYEEDYSQKSVEYLGSEDSDVEERVSMVDSYEDLRDMRRSGSAVSL